VNQYFIRDATNKKLMYHFQILKPIT